MLKEEGSSATDFLTDLTDVTRKKEEGFSYLGEKEEAIFRKGFRN